MKKIILGFFLALCMAPLFAANKTWTISEVLHNAQPRQHILVQGTITKAVTFDLFVLNDGSADLLINMQNVRQHLQKGDSLAAFGRYQGSVGSPLAKGQLDVSDFAPLKDGSAPIDFLQKYATSEAIAPAPSPTSSPEPIRNIESRLRELDDLKSKNLITDQEYRDQRKRILDGI